MANPRATSLDRTQSMVATGSHRASIDSHRTSIDMSDKRMEPSHSYMQSWDASAVANRNSSATSSERSPPGPFTQNESPRVRKPLVCDVNHSLSLYTLRVKRTLQW